MTSRRKKILFIQLFLFFAATILISFTYINLGNNSSKQILSEKKKREINEKIKKDKNDGNTFYDIVYSGLDLSGNRYIINAKEANNNNDNEGFVSLKNVNAVFYFKDNKKLNISSKFGLYNNKTLDMKFEKDVKAEYDGSTLLAEEAEYLSSKNLIEISNNVEITDFRGTLIAEKLVLDIEENKLNITSSRNKKVEANFNYK